MSGTPWKDDTFSVWITAAVLMSIDPPPLSKEGGGLKAEPAVLLAKQCSERSGVGRVLIVCERDDTISFEWTATHGVVFPPKPRPLGETKSGLRRRPS